MLSKDIAQNLEKCEKDVIWILKLLVWVSSQGFKKGQVCVVLSVIPLTKLIDVYTSANISSEVSKYMYF